MQRYEHANTLRANEQTRQRIVWFLEGWYDVRRLHSRIGYRLPLEFENANTQRRDRERRATHARITKGNMASAAVELIDTFRHPTDERVRRSRTMHRGLDRNEHCN
ncbi:hypothetical protein F6X42_10830 [Paraburkholderia sp. WC7.3b]|uniref:Integrase catalytic domain-containing protein n=1 Tax=Paraburkholderia podalyriae TaxID=1938811 RepID=A0ABR7PL36_9BURK|nr:hypothetical protein [Paraburkholderia podalyriae]